MAEPDAAKTDGYDLILQEISRTLQENQRFLQALKEDRLDHLEDDEEVEEVFEEL